MGRNFAGLERDTMKKIVQTAGRNALGKFAPEFAHYNDDILFGENWNKKAGIRKKGRSRQPCSWNDNHDSCQCKALAWCEKRQLVLSSDI